MNRIKSLFSKPIKWSKYQLEILVFAFVLDIAAFLWVKGKPECCDATGYLLEAARIKEHGFVPPWGLPWLGPFHNYLYATFIFLANSVGLNSRSSIAMLQVTLIFLACLIVSWRLSKILEMSRVQLMGLIFLVAFFPILAFSGYILTEALASSILILWIGLSLEMSFVELSLSKRKYLTLGTSLLAALLWMTRPSFLWIPVINFAYILLLELRRPESKVSRMWYSLETAALAFVATATVVFPQFLVTSTSLSPVNGIFHFDLWATWRPMESNLYRYVTNLSGCGPQNLYFSPFAQTSDTINLPYFHNSPIYRLSGFMARLVSGWDAVPSPLTYVNHLSNFPWIFLTAMTGFLITAPFFLLVPQKNKLYLVTNGYRRMEISLALLFIASQISAGMIHGEFRYNMAGWIIAGFALLLLPQHFRGGFPWKKYLAISVGVSLFVVVVGQLTLSLSTYWIACVK